MVNQPTNNTPFTPFAEMIIQGVRKAVRKLVEERAAKGQSLVIGDMDGTIKKVPAKELLEELKALEK